MGTAQCTTPTAVRQPNSGVPALGNILVKFCCDVTYALAEIASARYQQVRRIGFLCPPRPPAAAGGPGKLFDNQAVSLHPRLTISRLRSIGLKEDKPDYHLRSSNKCLWPNMLPTRESLIALIRTM